MVPGKRSIDPSLAAGFKDYLPRDMVPRQRIVDTIRSVFERFGFAPLDTPGLEREEVLTGGDPNFQMKIFRSRLREEDEGLALRFDLTVPLARVVSLYPDQIAKPFKRYQVGKVWRGEKPQAGRYREFVQFDADIVGSSRTMADAEIIALIYETMVALGLSRFLIRVNNRKVLNGLAMSIGFDQERTTDVLRIIDKLESHGWDNVSGELAEKIGLNSNQLSKLKQFLDLSADNPSNLLVELATIMGNQAGASEGMRELAEITQHLEALNVPSKNWVIDLSVARGLGYYTGPVFETVLTDLPSIGSVFSGGRFDALVERFGGPSIPATGASIGVDRLFSAMEKLDLLPEGETVTQVLILNFNPEAEFECERIAHSLRVAGFCTEIYLGKEVTISGQMAYAVRQGIPITILIGEREKARGTCQIKDMIRRVQVECVYYGALEKVREIIAEAD